MFAVKKIFRQTITTCDRIKHSIEKYEDVFVENIKFSVYIEISKSRDISLCADAEEILITSLWPCKPTRSEAGVSQKQIL